MKTFVLVFGLFLALGIFMSGSAIITLDGHPSGDLFGHPSGDLILSGHPFGDLLGHPSDDGHPNGELLGHSDVIY